MAARQQVGTEIGYPSMAAAIMGAALIAALGVTVGTFLISRDVVEVFLRQWLPFLLPFFDVLPGWALEAPWVLGALGIATVVAVRLLAGWLPPAALYLLSAAIICTGVLFGPPIREPATRSDWAFVSYVIVIALLGAAPPRNDFEG